jgi:glycosyltransferase involved in cell wall biosynthesis
LGRDLIEKNWKVLLNGYVIPITSKSQPTLVPRLSREPDNGQPTSTPCLPDRQALSLTTDNQQPRTENRQLLTAHCFLFPSWYEGFSGALVEAMMAGMPIIASDIPMNLEAVTDKESALIFPAKKINSLTGCMLWAIENPDRMVVLGNKARKVAIERFDIDLISNQYFQVLQKI